jgi:hypothetical protein
VSRASRVPYHQNVYDLLGIEPGESPEAARMIAEHEAQHGPLPASVKEWYLVPNVVLLDRRPDEWVEQWTLNEGKLWWEYSNQDPPVPLLNFLDDLAQLSEGPAPPYVIILHENQGVVRWWVEIRVNGSDDPPVWVDNDQPDDTAAWTRSDERFSEFLVRWFGNFYLQPWTPLSRNGSDAKFNGVRPFVKPYANRLWLRTPDEPFQPPVIDFLTDHFGEPERTARPGNVTTYTFRPPGGTIRVTADEPTLTGGLSAWWVHAETRERLAEFAELLRPWGTLRDTLRADTDPARAVLNRTRGA